LPGSENSGSRDPVRRIGNCSEIFFKKGFSLL
jgi:hypothetical protein